MNNPTEARREALRAFVADNGGHARVVAKYRLSASQASYLSQLITENSTASFGERSAKNWEDRLGIKDGRISNSPQTHGSPGMAPPPLPPRDFNDRLAVSESDWGVLQDVRLVMSDDQLKELRSQAERIRRIAREQMASVSSAGSEKL